MRGAIFKYLFLFILQAHIVTHLHYGECQTNGLLAYSFRYYTVDILYSQNPDTR